MTLQTARSVPDRLPWVCGSLTRLWLNLVLSVPGNAKRFTAARILCARYSWNTIKSQNNKIAEIQCLCWFQRFFIKASKESLLGLVPRIRRQSHTVISIWYHIACNRVLALRDTLFVNFILQTLAGKCGSREFWEWKLKGNNESFIGRYSKMRRTSACNSGRTCTGKNCVTKTNWNNCSDANRYG